jgi:hypothetical protein
VTIPLVVAVLLDTIEHLSSDLGHTTFVIMLAFFLVFPLAALFPQRLQFLCVLSHFLHASFTIFLIQLILCFILLLVDRVIRLKITLFIFFGDSSKTISNVIFE